MVGLDCVFVCGCQVDVLVTTAGGIEEDLIKCLAPTYMGDFAMQGAQLRSKGLNRIGNLLVPNDNYCKFEDWVVPILDQLLVEQKEQVCLRFHLCELLQETSSIAPCVKATVTML